MPDDPAPIRGRWTIKRVENVCAWGDTVQMVTAGPALARPVEVVPVPDEAAIERGAKARWDRDEQREVTRADGTLYRAVAWEAAHELDRAEYRAEALAVLRAALEAPE